MIPAVFLDRDGTINIEKNYLHEISDFEFEQGAIEAIQKLNEAGYKVLVISNQAGVARGYYREQDVEVLHEWVNNELAKYNAHIDKFYYCPHHPEHGIGDYKKICCCRKPGIELIEKAIQEFDINVKESYFIGDRETDIYAGLEAGLQSILVLTGYGRKARNLLDDYNVCAENIYEAVQKYIIME